MKKNKLGKEMGSWIILSRESIFLMEVKLRGI